MSEIQGQDRFIDEQKQELIWIQDAAEMLKVPIYQLDLWTPAPPDSKRKHCRCPWLGRQLPVYTRMVSGGNNRQYERRYLLVKDVLAIRDKMATGKPTPTVEPIPEDEISLKDAIGLGLGKGELMTARRKGSWRLNGRKIPGTNRPSVMPDGRIIETLYFKRADVDEILAHKKKHPKPTVSTHTDALGQVWVPAQESARLYNMEEATFRAAVERDELDVRQIHRPDLKHVGAAGRDKPPGKRGESESREGLWHYRKDGPKSLDSFVAQYQARQDLLKTAKAFLKNQLANDPVPKRKLRQEARRQEIPWKTVLRAVKELKIIKSQVGYQGESTWRLPDVTAPVAPKGPSPVLGKALRVLRGLDLTNHDELWRRAEAAGITSGTFYRALAHLQQEAEADPAGNGNIATASLAGETPAMPSAASHGTTRTQPAPLGPKQVWDMNVANHEQVADSIAARLASTKKRLDSGTVYHHGGKSYSLGAHSPVVVSDEENAILQAFLRVNGAMSTSDLGGPRVNVSRIVGQLDGKFGDEAVSRPGIRGPGYYIRIRPFPIE